MKKAFNFLVLATAILLVGVVAANLFDVTPLLGVTSIAAVSFVVSLSTRNVQHALLMAFAPRGWSNRKNDDNTGRVLTMEYIEPAYAATITVSPKGASRMYIKPAQLTGAATLNITLTNLKDLDEVVIILTTDATQRIVTFGANLLSSGTLTIPASKGAVVRGVYDATIGKVLIYGREIWA